MISRFINFCQGVNFRINLLELIKGSLFLGLITMFILGITKFLYIFNKERKIDQRVRARRARFARAITEIEEFNGPIADFEEVSTQIPQTRASIEIIDENISGQSKIEQNAQVIKSAYSDLYAADATTTPHASPNAPDVAVVTDTPDTPDPDALDAPTPDESEAPSIQEDSEKVINGKKTRAMSMEERWAEFDKKRAIRNTA